MTAIPQTPRTALPVLVAWVRLANAQVAAGRRPRGDLSPNPPIPRSTYRFVDISTGGVSR